MIFRQRVRIIYIILCVGMLLLAGRLFYLQVLQITDTDPDYHLLPRSTWRPITPTRGTITDRHGNLMAMDRSSLDLAVNYKFLADEYIEPWLAEACRLTGKTPDEVRARRDTIVRRVKAARERVMAWRRQRNMRSIDSIREEVIPHALIRNIPHGLVVRIETDPESFKGAMVMTSLQRIYPEGKLAAHTLGYVTRARRPDSGGYIRGNPELEPGDRIGELGLERHHDALLRGAVGYYELAKDSKTGALNRRIVVPVRDGENLRLSLDMETQRRAEAALDGQMGAVVVMDVHNGEILVMASAPTYDNNDIADAYRRAHEAPRGTALFTNRAMRSSIPSGSVIKPLIALAGARAGKLTPRTNYFCGRTIRLGGRRWRCTGSHGNTEMERAIERSCNIWFYKAGMATGSEAIAKLLRECNWGSKTGLDMPWEHRGNVPTAQQRGSVLNLSIGQGRLLVTPLQVTVAMAAIANGGMIVRPHLRMHTDPDTPPPNYVVRHIDLPTETLTAVRDGMWRVTGRRGTARRVRQLRDMGVAAKTGTADIGNGTGLNYAWIAGYLPHDAPRYAFAVVIHNTSGHGGDAAGPVAAATLAQLVRP
jgi:penicillin-binding protein 2